MNNSHNERMTKEAKQAAFGDALAKVGRMSLDEAKAIYGDDFQATTTVKEMRAKGWGLLGRVEMTMRSCGFKHQSFYYEFLHHPKGGVE